MASMATSWDEGMTSDERLHALRLDDYFTVEHADAVCLDAPSQSMMLHFAANFPGIESLRMELEYGNGGESLDFSDIVLPSLLSLSLTCVNVRELKFTSDNTPKLERISLSRISGGVSRFSTSIFPSSKPFPLSTLTSVPPRTHSACR
jgi:hypothetical protein